MPTTTLADRWAPRREIYALAVVLLLLGGAIGTATGVAYARMTDNPHVALSERIVGTVTWSNQETRLIAVEADGVVPDPQQPETHYLVIADGWEDAAGTGQGGGTYPSCLVSEEPDNEVSTDRHRVELDVIHRGGSAQLVHIAIHVRCLD